MAGHQDKDPAVTVEPDIATRLLDVAVDLAGELRVVAGLLKAEDDEIDSDAMLTPISMSSERLPNQLDLTLSSDRNQEDRIVPGDSIRPQRRLPFAIRRQSGGRGA